MTHDVRQRQEGLLELTARLARSNERLAETNALLSAVMETALDALIVIDEFGIVLSFNPAAESMFGYAADVVVGNNVSMLMPEPERNGHDGHIRRYLATGRSKIIGTGRELIAARADGSTFPIELGLSAMQVGGKRLFLGVASDISRRKRAERQKDARHIAELKRSNEELAQFAYVASHDLQEPLRAVAAHAERLTRRYRGRWGDDADRLIGFVIDGVDRMKALIDDVLAYSLVSQADIALHSVETGPVVEMVARSMADRLSGAEATLTYGDLPTIHADVGQLERLFTNLIDNAIKYRAARRSPQIAITAERCDEFWRFAVADNGIGIDPQFSEKIFGMFTRLHRDPDCPGTGIGLASCRRIVERHGGTIGVLPNSGGGSVFVFTLPAVTDSGSGADRAA